MNGKLFSLYYHFYCYNNRNTELRVHTPLEIPNGTEECHGQILEIFNSFNFIYTTGKYLRL